MEHILTVPHIIETIPHQPSFRTRQQTHHGVSPRQLLGLFRSIVSTQIGNRGSQNYYIALLTVSKKWTCDLSMTRVASWRHILETHMNRFALILQVHDTKPLDDLAYQASIRQG